MPFQSRAQARWMFANKPRMAREWADKTGSVKALPERVGAQSRRPKGGGGGQWAGFVASPLLRGQQQRST